MLMGLGTRLGSETAGREQMVGIIQVVFGVTQKAYMYLFFFKAVIGSVNYVPRTLVVRGWLLCSHN